MTSFKATHSTSKILAAQTEDRHKIRHYQEVQSMNKYRRLLNETRDTICLLICTSCIMDFIIMFQIMTSVRGWHSKQLDYVAVFPQACRERTIHKNFQRGELARQYLMSPCIQTT